VADVETKKHKDRRNQLLKINEHYAKMLHERRQTLRTLSEHVGSAEPIAGIRKDVLSRLYYDLRSQRIQLKLERAEAETLLGRRRKTAGDSAGSARIEIERIEDRLAALGARDAVVVEELKQIDREIQDPMSNASRALDVASLQDEIAQMRQAAHTVGAEIERLNIELGAPSRIRLIEEAAPTR
jgi:hypothetical protein